MELYGYFRSSAAYRVRIALKLKSLNYDLIPVHLLNHGGEQLLPPYRKINPAGLVPALVDDGAVLTQSLAIIEYLDEVHPQPPLLPADPLARARVRALALSIACDIHPLANLRVLRHLGAQFQLDDDGRNRWVRHWNEQGLAALETSIAANGKAGLFCHGDTPTLADCCLVPQIFNALRFQCDLTAMPTLMRIYEHCMTLPAFIEASPERQPDAPPAP